MCGVCCAGTGGISYDGMSAFRLASGDKSGAVRAAALMFSPVDPYSELLVPGGLLDIGFFGDYTTFTSAAERNIPVEVRWRVWEKCLLCQSA